MPSHTCHARGCEAEVPPAMFMCKKHWFALPKPLRDEVWRTYRRGQEVSKDPSKAYLEAASAAIDYLVAQEPKLPFGGR